MNCARKVLRLSSLLMLIMTLAIPRDLSAAATAPPPLAFNFDSSWWIRSAFAAGNTSRRTVGGDFNGDGKGDIAMIYRTQSNTVDFYVLTSAGDRFEFQGSWLTLSGFLTADMMTGKIVAGDFDNDGKDDIAVFAGTFSTILWIFPSTGEAFENRQGVTVDYPGGSDAFPADWQDAIPGLVTAGDFDGNGIDDVAVLKVSDGTKIINLMTVLSNGERMRFNNWGTIVDDVGKARYRVVAGDWNGDGRDDLAQLYYDGGQKVRLRVQLSTGSSFRSELDWWTASGYNADEAFGRVVAGDFDGDLDDDIAILYRYPTLTRAHVLLSDRTQFVYQGNGGWWATGTYQGPYAADRTVAGDWDGNGVDDIGMIHDAGRNSTGSPITEAHTLLSTAVGSQAAGALNVDASDDACSDTVGQPYCTVQAAINAAGAADTIRLAPGLYAENITLPRYSNRGYQQEVTIEGAAVGVEIRGSSVGGASILDGGNAGSVVTVGLDAVLTMNHLTIQNGNADDDAGGGIHNLGTTILEDVRVTANQAIRGSGGAIYNAGTATIDHSVIELGIAELGGGIENRSGVLTLRDSLVMDNIAAGSTGAQGGGLRNSSGTVTIERSTVVSNTTDGAGGGIAHKDGGQTTISNSTVSGNRAVLGGGIYQFNPAVDIGYSTIYGNDSSDQGGGLYSEAGGETTLHHVVIAGNSAPDGANCHLRAASTISSQGYNFSDSAGCTLDAATDVSDRDPQLGALEPYGAGFAHMPAKESPVIDGGSPSCSVETDQSGSLRPLDGDWDGVLVCDIGAVEVRAEPDGPIPVFVPFLRR